MIGLLGLKYTKYPFWMSQASSRTCLVLPNQWCRRFIFVVTVLSSTIADFRCRKFQEILIRFSKHSGCNSRRNTNPGSPKYNIQFILWDLKDRIRIMPGDKSTSYKLHHQQTMVNCLSDGPKGQRYYLYYELFWFAVISEDIGLPWRFIWNELELLEQF